MGKNLPATVSRTLFRDNVIETHRVLSQFPAGRPVMGLDPSISGTAVAVYAMHAKTYHISTSPEWIRANPAELKQTQRIVGTRSYLKSVFRKYAPRFLVIEDYSYGSPGRLAQMAEVGGMIRALCWDNPMSVGATLLVAPTQLKKYILGKGDGQQSKDRVMVSVLDEMKIKPRNNNEGDALVLSLIAKDLVEKIEQLVELANECKKDTDIKELMKTGHKTIGLPRYRWEVMMKLIAERGGQHLLQFRDEGNDA